MRNLPAPTVRKPRPRKRDRHGDEVYEFIVRLSEPLYRQLEAYAHEQRTSKVEVVRMALRRML
jgi:hypothetical protein